MLIGLSAVIESTQPGRRPNQLLFIAEFERRCSLQDEADRDYSPTGCEGLRGHPEFRRDSGAQPATTDARTLRRSTERVGIVETMWRAATPAASASGDLRL